MARRKTPQPADWAIGNQPKRRIRIQVVNGRGKRRMMWQDEYEGRNA